MWPALFSLLSPAGAKGRLSVLIFHRVHAQSDPLFPDEPDARRFDTLCGWLAHWFNVLPLGEAMARLPRGALPERAAAITFDDGYADNHDVAAAILRRHGLSATFFVATGFLDGGRMWNDSVVEAVRRAPADRLDLGTLLPPALHRRIRTGEARSGLPADSPAGRRALIDALLPAIKYLPPKHRDETVAELVERSGSSLPDDLMMSSAQVVALRDAGMGIGAHTVTHPILKGMAEADVRHELAASRETLEGLLGEAVKVFAYPNGKPGVDYDASSVAVAKGLGFSAAFSTAWGAAGVSSDPLQLPRFTPWDRARGAFAFRMLRNLRHRQETA